MPLSEEDVYNHNASNLLQRYYVGGYDNKDLIRPDYDFDELKKISSVLCENLNKIIDNNYYPTPESKLSNFKHRPIGIGIQGLANLYIKMRYNFDSDEANKLNKNIMETIYYGALEKSIELAKERESKIDSHLENNNLEGLQNNLGYKINDSFEQFEKDIARSKFKRKLFYI